MAQAGVTTNGLSEVGSCIDVLNSEIIFCNSFRLDTVRLDTIRLDTVRFDTVRFDTVRFNNLIDSPPETERIICLIFLLNSINLLHVGIE